MNSQPRVFSLLGAAIAPAVPALVGAFSSRHLITQNPQMLLEVSLIYYGVTLVLLILLGIPLAFALRQLEIYSTTTVAITGAVVGIVILQMLKGGADLTPLSWGWYGVVGALCALTYYAVCRRSM